MEKKVTYEMENGKKVKVETYANGDVRKYDENGNLIHWKNNDGYEEWNEYDSNGNRIHYKDSTGTEIWWECDPNGYFLHVWDNDGEEWFCDDYEARKVY